MNNETEGHRDNGSPRHDVSSKHNLDGATSLSRVKIT